MVTKNREKKNLGHAMALACILDLAASSVGAIGIDGRPPRRDPVRSRQLRAMDVFLTNYGSTDFSAVQDALEASPAGAGNPEIMSVALSLGNDYLSRFERYGASAYLARALDSFESVAARRDLWGGRPRSGAVVAYLDMSVARVNGECEVSGFQDRINALSLAALSLTAQEATAASDAEESSELSVSSTPEDNAARAALYVWAASLLSDDPRAEQWRVNAGRIVTGFSLDDCQSDETVLALSQAALGYELFGKELPAGFRTSATSRARRLSSTCSPSIGVYQTSEPVSVVEPGETLAAAVHDGMVVAYDLSELFLRQFPPGSQCLDDEEDDPKHPRAL